MNDMFALKQRELLALDVDFEMINDKILVINENNKKIVVGCEDCYMITPVSDTSGYYIPAGKLINYHEKFSEQKSAPTELGINCWLCPTCGRPFLELLPRFKMMEVKNVSL